MGAYIKSANLIPFPYDTQSTTINGITFTVNNDGSITIDGTATANARFNLRLKKLELPYGKYTLTGLPSNINASGIGIVLAYGLSGTYVCDYGAGVTYNVDKPINIIYVIIYSGHTFNNIKVYPMLNEGPTAKPYEPFNKLTKVNLIGAVRNPENLIPFPYNNTSTTINGVTFTVQDDGSVLCSGTATNTTTFKLCELAVDTDLYFNGSPPNSTNSTFFMVAYGHNTSIWIAWEAGKGAKILKSTMEERGFTSVDVAIVVYRGVTVDNAVFKPMLNGGTTAKPYYVPQKVKAYMPVRNPENLIPFPYKESTLTRNGVTFTDNGDGSVTVNGTATANAYFFFLKKGVDIPLRAGNYTCSGYTDNVAITLDKNKVYWGTASVGNPSTFEAEDGDICGVMHLTVFAGKTADNEKVYPMLNEGDTAKPYYVLKKI